MRAVTISLAVLLFSLPLGRPALPKGLKIKCKAPPAVADWDELQDHVDVDEVVQVVMRETPVAAFEAANRAFEQGDFWAAYAYFDTFARGYPSFAQGHINKGLALERLKLFDYAICIYKQAAIDFPEEKDPRKYLVGALQLRGADIFNQGNYAGAIPDFEVSIKLDSMRADSYFYLGQIQDRSNLDSLANYKKATELQPDHQRAQSSLCKAYVNRASGGGASLVAKSLSERQSWFSKAKETCTIALQLDPKDSMAMMSMGLMFKEGLDFKEAIRWMEKARQASPKESVILSNLAATLAREGDVPKAVKYVHQAIKLRGGIDEGLMLAGLATFISPYNRSSEEAFDARRKGHKLFLETVQSPAQLGLVSAKEGKHWRICEHYVGSKRADVKLLRDATLDPVFGTATPPTAFDVPFDTPLLFKEKSTFHVMSKDVYMQGESGTEFAGNEVYLYGISSDITTSFRPTKELLNAATMVTQPTLNLLHIKSTNYYHLTAEVLTRYAAIRKYMPDQLAAMKLLMPPREGNELAWQGLELLESDWRAEHPDDTSRPWKERVIEFTAPFTYRIAELHSIMWRAEDPNDLRYEDLWSDYLPTKESLHLLRDWAVSHQDVQLSSDGKLAQPEIIYTLRSSIRSVKNVELLLKLLRKHLGKAFKTFELPTKSGNKVKNQMQYFQNTAILIGPHGAGLSNIVYASHAALIEFAMKPHSNRCFGYMAQALGNPYTIVPQVHSFYHKNYEMTRANAKLVAQLVHDVLEEQGYGHLWQGSRQLDSNEIKDEL
eukprot:TRINITY_DN11484_c0_g1_i1.p1 TRINITY_DN11484_c0_g1~~TRINITY_DN11484_c0_g1_i1.p1  ORF type:complete len:777 (+),score=194.89 TRINITY_DN11484_c0_g1_i1:151-2481(+)